MYQTFLKFININLLYCPGLKKHDTANFHTQKQSLQLPTLIRRFHTDRYATTINNPEKLLKQLFQRLLQDRSLRIYQDLEVASRSPFFIPTTIIVADILQ